MKAHLNDEFTLKQSCRGQRVRIMSMNCCRHERKRLASMGLFPGCGVTVLGRGGNGALFVRSGETSLVLDGDICSSVLCRRDFFCTKKLDKTNI